MANIYAGNNGIPQGEAFKSATGVALCGFRQNQYTIGAFTTQAKIGNLDPKTLLSCTPVSIKNDNAEANGTDMFTGFNPKTFAVEKAVASNTDKIDGFILEDGMYVTDEAGNAGIPLEHGTVQVGKIGSGVQVFLPANANLVNVNLSTVLYWDPTNKEITTTSADMIALTGVQLLSSVVNGKARKLTGDTIAWEDCTCVLVQL